MKAKPLTLEHLAAFDAYRPDDRAGHVESERFRRFTYAELEAHDKFNLGITWLKDDSLEDRRQPACTRDPHRRDPDKMAALMAQFAELAASIGVEVVDPADL